MAIFFFVWLFFIGFDDVNGGVKSFIYLTNWAYLVWTTYLIWSAISSTCTFLYFHFLCKQKFVDEYNEIDVNICSHELVLDDRPTGCCGKTGDRTFWYQKIDWVLYTVGTSMAVTVCILYWSLIYNPDEEPPYNIYGGVNLVTHAVNGVVAVVDVLVTGIPFRLLHVLYSIMFSGTYACFTGFYYAGNGTNAVGQPYIYPLLDYGETSGFSAGVVILVIFIYVPLNHLLMYGFYLLREGLLCLNTKYCCGKQTDEQKLKEDFEMS